MDIPDVSATAPAPAPDSAPDVDDAPDDDIVEDRLRWGVGLMVVETPLLRLLVAWGVEVPVGAPTDNRKKNC